MLAKYPQRGLLLAVEAVKAGQSLHGDRVAAAEQSLREALAFIGGRPVASVHAVAISPDSHWVVTGSEDTTARLWLPQINELINLARVTAGRNLSADEWRLYFPSEPYHKTFPDLSWP
jgi:WD40 repeat protein